MTQRHDHDSVAVLPWEGFNVPDSLAYVAPELRDAVAAIPPGIERKMRRELAQMSEVVATDSNRKSHTLNPAKDDNDLEVAVVLRKVAWARTKLASEQSLAEQTARDAATYRCAGCGQVVSPSPLDRRRHTQRRTLGDRTSIVCCGQCATVAEQVAVERLAADSIAGTTRRDRVCKLMTAATP